MNLESVFIYYSIIIAVVSMILIYGVYFWKGKVPALLTSLLFGFVSLFGFMYVINWSGLESNGDFNATLDSVRSVYNIIGFIFIRMILIVVPFYLILVIASLVFSENFGKIKASTYGVSFASLLTLSLIGIIIAMVMIPLVMLIPDSIWSDIINSNTIETLDGSSEAASFNWFALIIFSIIILSFVISTIIRISMKGNIEKLSQFTKKGLSYIGLYFKIIIFAIPLVLFTRLSTIGMTESLESATAQLAIMGIYIGMYMFGAIIIFAILFTWIILASDKGLSFREKSKIIGKYSLTSFSNQSAAVTLPETINTTKELGVCEEIANLTPSKGLFMGMVMCNGFTPMLMSLFIISGAGVLTIANVFLLAILIFTLSVSTSGAGSSDYWITATSMSVVLTGGLGNIAYDAIYLDVILPAHEINEMTVAKPLNGLGHISATLTTEMYHKSVTPCDRCSNHIEHINKQIESDNSDEVK